MVLSKLISEEGPTVKSDIYSLGMMFKMYMDLPEKMYKDMLNPDPSRFALPTAISEFTTALTQANKETKGSGRHNSGPPQRPPICPQATLQGQAPERPQSAQGLPPQRPQFSSPGVQSASQGAASGAQSSPQPILDSLSEVSKPLVRAFDQLNLRAKADRKSHTESMTNERKDEIKETTKQQPK